MRLLALPNSIIVWTAFACTCVGLERVPQSSLSSERGLHPSKPTVIAFTNSSHTPLNLKVQVTTSSVSSLSSILPSTDLKTSSVGPNLTSSSKSTSSETKTSFLRSLSSLSSSYSSLQSSSIRHPDSDDDHFDTTATSPSRLSRPYLHSSAERPRPSSILVSNDSDSLGGAHSSSLQSSSVISGASVKSEARQYSVFGTTAAFSHATGLADQELTLSGIHLPTSSASLAMHNPGSVIGNRHSYDGNITVFDSRKHDVPKTCQTATLGNWKNAKSCSCISRKWDWESLYSTGMTTTKQCVSDPPNVYCQPLAIPALARPYTEPHDCCDRCEIAGESVELLYWPDSDSKSPSVDGNLTVTAQAAGPSGSESNGYTFISPSVYISYKNLQAWTSCAGAVQFATIPGSYSGGIQAYRPEQISSQKCIVNALDGRFAAYCLQSDDPRATAAEHCFRGIDAGWEAVNFEELANPPPDSVLYQKKRSCFPGDLGFKFEPKDARSMFLNPRIKLPNDNLRAFFPEWQAYANGSCGAGVFGLNDPPRVLGAASALKSAPGSGTQDSDLGESVALTTANAVNPEVTKPALPGEQLTNPQPAATPPPKMPTDAKDSPEPPSRQPNNIGSDSVPISPSKLGAASGQQPGDTDSEPLQDTTSDPKNTKTIPDTSQRHAEHPDSDSPPNDPTRPDGSKASPGSPGGKQSNSLKSDPMQHTSNNPDDSKTSPPYAGGQSGNVNSGPDQNTPSGPSDSSKFPDLGLDNFKGRPGPDSHKNDGPGGGSFQPEIQGSSGTELAQALSIQKLQNGDIVVGSSHTLSPGSAPLTISGHFISYAGPSHVAIDGSSVFNIVPLPTLRPIAHNSGEIDGSGQPQQPEKNVAGGIVADGASPVTDVDFAAITLRPESNFESGDLALHDGMVIQKLQNDKIVLDSSYTITPGPTPLTVLGHTIAYPDPTHVVSDHSSTYTLLPIPANQAFIIDAEDGNSVQQLSPLSRDSNGNVVIDGITLPLLPSGAADAGGGAAAKTIAGHVLSLRGSDILVEDSTKTFSIPPMSNAYLLRNIDAYPTISATMHNALPSSSAYTLIFDKIDTADLGLGNTTMSTTAATGTPIMESGQAILAYNPSSAASSLHSLGAGTFPFARLHKYRNRFTSFIVGDNSAGIRIQKINTYSFFLWLLPVAFLVYHQF